MILPPRAVPGNRERARLPDGAPHGVVEVRVPEPARSLLGDAPSFSITIRSSTRVSPRRAPAPGRTQLLRTSPRAGGNSRATPGKAGRFLRSSAPAPRSQRSARRTRGGGASIRGHRSPTPRTRRAPPPRPALLTASRTLRSARAPASSQPFGQRRAVGGLALRRSHASGRSSSLPAPAGEARAPSAGGAGSRPRRSRRRTRRLPVSWRNSPPPIRSTRHRFEAQRGPNRVGTASAAIAGPGARPERASMSATARERSGKNGEPSAFRLYRSSGSVTMQVFRSRSFDLRDDLHTNPYGTERSARKYT